MAVTAMATDTDMGTDIKNKLCWYPLRVTYSRELKVRDRLLDRGFSCFVPLTLKSVEKGGVRTVKTVPAVSNLCFVRGTRAGLDEAVEELGMKDYVSYVWDRATRKPTVVPDKAMEDFMRVSGAMMDDVVYLLEVNTALRAGRKVRVKSGPFAGVEGVVVRVKRSRRVMVELPGMFAVATSYVPEENLELI